MFAAFSRISRQRRFALFYGAFYLGFGAYLPFMPVWLEGRGLSPEMIGLATAAAMAGRVIAAPVGAALADRAPRRRDAVIGFSMATVFLFLAHIPATNPWLIVALAGVAGGAYTGVIPIIDSFAVREATRKRFAFGPARAFGSVTFIFGNIASGALITGLGPQVAGSLFPDSVPSLIREGFGSEAALYWTLTGAGLAIMAAVILPPGKRSMSTSHTGAGNGFNGLIKVLSSNGLPLAFAVSALVQGAHGFYYAFSAVAWTAQGIPAVAVGLLWATGVLAEIIFLWQSDRWFKSVSPTMMLVLGASASVLRWGLLALSPPLILLFPLQLLHAFTFGATYLGFLKFAAEQAPERYGATTQALNSALSGGLVLAAATSVSGFAYSQIGTAGFAMMTLPAGIGVICALLLSRRAKNTP